MENTSKGFENWKKVMRIPTTPDIGDLWNIFQGDWTFHKQHYPSRIPAGFENCTWDDLEFKTDRKRRYWARPAGTDIPFHVWRGACAGFEAK